MSVEAPPAKARLILLDALRGVAAVWVMFHHFSLNPVFDGARLREVTPAPLAWLLRNGDLGVVIFFVLSGFVIAHSLFGQRLTWGRLGNFVIRRSLRLDPPYFVTIALVVAVNAASNLFLKSRTVEPPSAGLVLSHLVYLQELVYGRSLLGVFWTLCLEVQLYLSFALLTLTAHRLARPDAGARGLARAAAWVVLPFALVATYWPLAAVPLVPRDGTLLGYWYLFLLGVYARWAWADRAARAAFAGLVFAALVAAAAHGDRQAAAAAVTASLIWAGAVSGVAATWPDWRWLQYLGGISYSLYLIHDVFGVRLLNLATRLPEKTLSVELGLFAVATASSVAAAHALNRAVERPAAALSRKLHWGRRAEPEAAPRVVVARLPAPQGAERLAEVAETRGG